MNYFSIEVYAADRNGTWCDFFGSPVLTRSCGSRGRIAKVRVTPDDNGTHWAAFYATPIDLSPYIFETKEQVEICSPDFFDSKIAAGQMFMTRVRVDLVEWCDP